MLYSFANLSLFTKLQLSLAFGLVFYLPYFLMCCLFMKVVLRNSEKRPNFRKLSASDQGRKIGEVLSGW